MALLASVRSPFAKPFVTLPVYAQIQRIGIRHLNLQSYIVTPKDLSNALTRNVPTKNSKSRVVPLCAAWFLPNNPAGRSGQQVFQQRRIPTAKFFDLDAVKDHESPYPHMLPSAEDFAKAMQKMGIRKEDELVVYDSQEAGIFSAPRVAWTLKVFGHPGVHILNNFRQWVEQGYPTESAKNETAVEEPSYYPVPNLDSSKVVHFSEMKKIAEQNNKQGSKDVQVLDARSRGRWSGTDPEPRPGLPSGHIPGSINMPMSEVLDPSTGTFLPGQKLKKIFESKGLDPQKPMICTCGTGVTAAAVDAALTEAGFGDPAKRRLYDGSWTEWALRVNEADDMIRTTK
ncbi:MAG: hypothetical protein Q9170_007043 [Blastenia crenularia]